MGSIIGHRVRLRLSYGWLSEQMGTFIEMICKWAGATSIWLINCLLWIGCLRQVCCVIKTPYQNVKIDHPFFYMYTFMDCIKMSISNRGLDSHSLLWEFTSFFPRFVLFWHVNLNQQFLFNLSRRIYYHPILFACETVSIGTNVNCALKVSTQRVPWRMAYTSLNSNAITGCRAIPSSTMYISNPVDTAIIIISWIPNKKKTTFTRLHRLFI